MSSKRRGAVRESESNKSRKGEARVATAAGVNRHVYQYLRMFYSNPTLSLTAMQLEKQINSNIAQAARENKGSKSRREQQVLPQWQLPIDECINTFVLFQPSPVVDCTAIRATNQHQKDGSNKRTQRQQAPEGSRKCTQQDKTRQASAATRGWREAHPNF